MQTASGRDLAAFLEQVYTSSLGMASTPEWRIE
jgi:hypothetical protein